MQDTEQPEPDHFDVAGQPNGPHPDIQAQVDAEQLAMIERIKAQRAPAEAEERRRMQAKIDAANAAASERRSLMERVKQLEARVTVLEAK